jgi:hypothetical protein
MKKVIIFLLGVFLFANDIQAQYVSTKVNSTHQKYTDSLKQVDYKYVFPILGQKAYKKGFDIPYPAGAMINYMWMKQGITIDNLQLGIKTDDSDIPLTPVDFVEFGENVNTSYTVNMRPDLWVLPFLNVYGIFGYGKSHTEVNLVAPFQMKSIVEQNISTAGIGIMGAGGIGPVWFSVDANWTWNKPELLEDAVRVNVLGIRFGHTFVIKNSPDSNIAVWAGAMSVNMSSSTIGEIKLNDALPQETWDRRDEIVTEYRDWYENDASPLQKIVADQTLTPIVDRLEAADGESIIRYGLDKQVKEKWNGVIGVQYQYNKHWMLRSEGGLIGDRKSFLISLNYRFLL